MATLTAWAFVVLAAFVVAFQVALVAGAPWGHLTMGGRFPGRLPTGMRGVAAFSALLLVAFAVIVAARASIALPGMGLVAPWFVWIVVGYSVLGVVANAATPSRGERALWLPVTIAMLACSLIVALAT